MPKRILIFSLTYFPFVGGAEVALKEITKRIPESEIEFDLITLRFDSRLPKFETQGNVTIYRLGFTTRSPKMADLYRFPLQLNKYLFPFLAWMKAAQLHGTRPYDAMWSIMANYAGFAALFFKRRHKNIPFLLTLQEGDSIEHIKKRVGIFYLLFKNIFLNADFIQAISTYLAEFARSMDINAKVAVVPNGVDVELFSKDHSDEELHSLTEQLGKHKDDKYIITISRLVAKNAAGDIIRALTHLPPNVKLLVIGTGPDERQLEDLVGEISVQDRVHFLGQIAYDELPKYLKISDVFVRPSLSEGMGNSFIEAMAAHVPVIATPVGGITDFLFDPDKNSDIDSTGLFCEVRNPQSIAQQVTRILNDQTLRNRITSNARKLVAEQYDWNMVAAAMREKIFGKLLQ